MARAMRIAAPLLIALFVVACAHARPAPVVDLGPAATSPPVRVTVSPDTDAERRAARFPGGPGTPLLVDDLQAALLDPRVRGPNLSPFARASAAAELLHVEPMVEDDHWVFYGIGPRTAIAPHSCHALRIDAWGPTLELGDHHGCGLPYANLGAPPALGARFTVERLRDAVANERIGWLGAADRVEGGRSTWFGVGPRGDDAPITCHALRVNGTSAKIELVPLDECGITWPAPAAGFVAAPPQREYGVRELADMCHGCGPRDVCVLSEVAADRARIHEYADRVVARWDDGRPAKLDVTATCWPLPATCTDAFQCARAIPCPSGDPPAKLERGTTSIPTRATCRWP